MFRKLTSALITTTILLVVVAYIWPEGLARSVNWLTGVGWDNDQGISPGGVALYLARSFGPLLLVCLVVVRVAYGSIFGNDDHA